MREKNPERTDDSVVVVVFGMGVVVAVLAVVASVAEALAPTAGSRVATMDVVLALSILISPSFFSSLLLMMLLALELDAEASLSMAMVHSTLRFYQQRPHC